MTRTNRMLVFASRPTDLVGPEHFKIVEAAVPNLAPGEALVRVHVLGIDPTQRTWLNPEETYISPARLGRVMPGSGVGQVVDTRNPSFPIGAWVFGMTGWQSYVVAREETGLFGLNLVPPAVRPEDMLGIFGPSGLAAYFGMLDIARPAEGQTAFVTGAAGSTGSIAGQIGRILGCRTVGSAGGDYKCRWVVDTAGFDGCIDYKSQPLADRLVELAPSGIDIVFDNVGGEALEAALDHLAPGARVVLCGSISSRYRSRSYGGGPGNYMQLAFKRARMEGFIFLDYADRFPEAFDRLKTWRNAGLLTVATSVSEGLESAPSALAGLFAGKNLGKQLVRLPD